MIGKFIRLKIFGDVDQVLFNKILDVIVKTYERLGPPMTGSLDLCVFESSMGDVFFASHNALQGRSTINIYMDKVSRLPFEVVVGGVRRQVAHSILHGSPEYYKIQYPAELKRALDEYGFPQAFAMQILYGISMAAKEFAVTKFLVEGGFIEDQVAYAKYMLEPAAEETAAWEIVKENPISRIIYLVMTIRDLSCAPPLTQNPEVGDEIKTCIERKISQLPQIYQSKIARIINETFAKPAENTFENIDKLAKAIVKQIIATELTFHKQNL